MEEDLKKLLAPPPNLLFVFADQMRGQAMGFLGEEKVKTPVLDKFATERIYFTEGDYYRDNIKNYYACISGVDEQ